MPSPVVASVFTIGGRHCRARSCAAPASPRSRRPSGPVAVRLVDHEDVRTPHDPGLQRLHLVARPRHQRDDGNVGHPDDVDLVLADADGFNRMTSLPPASRISATSPVDRDRPPRWPRVAIHDEDAGVSACACMRTRSPRMAPPLNGVGSTAMTPTVFPPVGSPRSGDRPACSCRRRAVRDADVLGAPVWG